MLYLDIVNVVKELKLVDKSSPFRPKDLAMTLNEVWDDLNHFRCIIHVS